VITSGVIGSRRLLSALLLFVGSGCAALIYEVVWFQLLEFVIGSSAVSMGVLLATFMGGMCLGSLLVPRVMAGNWHPLRVYAFLELGIGTIAVLLLLGMPLIGGTYSAWTGRGLVGILLRGVAAGACLLPPTMLMGATLPVMARWVEASSNGVAWLGLFYGGNTAGAVVGSLLAGFYLLRVGDINVTTYVAAALNAAVAGVALVLARTSPYQLPVVAPARASRVRGRWVVHLAIGLSGLTALSAEVQWTRTLTLLFGATTYAFSLILAMFLAGIGIGSSVGSVLGRGLARPRVALAWCQLLLCAAMAWTAFLLNDSLPYWPINLSIATNLWTQFQLDVTRCGLAVLPAALLWGASFPLALASVASRDEDPARVVGGIYAANTLGAIVGSVGTSLVLIGWLGSQRTQQLLIVITALSALFVLWQERRSAALVSAAAVAAALLAFTVPALPGLLVAFGRHTATNVGQAEIIYVGEGWNATVAVSERRNGVRNYHSAGKVQASSEPRDMRLQRMLGHLTTLVPSSARSVLVIGCGAGVTAGAVAVDPRVEHEIVAEIEPLVPWVASTYFAEHNFDVVHNPKVSVQIDDARHFLLTTGEKFDAVTSDVLDPWVKGAAMLYTREFFELVKQHLNPGGVVTLWVELYETNAEAVKSELGTFFEAFPRGMVFANTYNGAGYDLVLLGQVEGTTIDLNDLEERLTRPEYALVAKSLEQIGVNSAVDLMSTFAGQARDFSGWLADAEINRDRNLRLQYLAGWGLNLNRAATIYSDMVGYARQPQGIFTGALASRQALSQKIWESLGRKTTPPTLHESMELLGAAVRSRTAPLGFEIAAGKLAWRVSGSQLNPDTLMLSFHPDRGVDFQLQLTSCDVDNKLIWSDGTLLGPKEGADAFYRDNLKYSSLASDIEHRQCADSRNKEWESHEGTDRRVVYKSEARLLKQMVNWMVSLARSHDSERARDFLRVIVTRQRDALLQAAGTSYDSRVAGRLELFDSVFPFSIFDVVTLQAQERQAVRGWLETTIEARMKLQRLQPAIARDMKRDAALLTRLSQPDQK